MTGSKKEPFYHAVGLRDSQDVLEEMWSGWKYQHLGKRKKGISTF